MNETRIASMAFAAYFVSSLDPRVGHDHPLAGELQRGVEGPEQLAGVLAPRAEDDAIGPEEVLPPRSLP